MRPPPAIGIARLARFRADGLAAFDASPTGLLNALAPWVAFALVGFVLVVVSGSPRVALGDLFATLVALLTPAVLSHALARLWRHEAGWLRYAVAVVWCQWVMPPALLAAVILSGVLVAAGLPSEDATLFGALALLAYALSLNFFIARHALDLSRWRTLALVAIVNLGTGALVTVPVLLQGLLAPTAAPQTPT
jgi:hypothetical protein